MTGSLLSTLQALAPDAIYPHDDTAVGTMRDASTHARTGTYQAAAQLKAAGVGGTRTSATAYRLHGDPGGGSKLALPPPGAIWNSNTWTVHMLVRAWGFEDPDNIWCADTNGVFTSPTVRFVAASAGTGYRPVICLRDGTLANTATSAGDFTDTYKWHQVICRVNNLTAGSIRVDGVDCTPAWTNQAYAFSGTPTPNIGGAFGRLVLQYTTFWASYVSDANCDALYAAFQAENIVPAPRLPVYIGTHTNLDDQSDSGIRHNQTRVAVRDGANVTRSDFYPDQWNTGAGTYDWTTTDDIFSDCASKGLRVWVLMHSSPGYTHGGGSRWKVPGGPGVDATFLTWVGLMQTAWSAFATRYKAGGTGNPTGLTPIYELWNEPNSATEWLSQNGAAFGDAAQWARFCKSLNTTVTTADPSAIMVLGGVNSWSAPGTNEIAGETFWRTAIATGDLAGFTRFGVHPYVGSNASPDTNANFDNSYDDFLIAVDVLGELGFGTAEVWITEVGWTPATSQADQSTKLSLGATRWRDYWRPYSSAFIFWPDWDSVYGAFGLYSTMPNTGADPTARTAAATYSAIMLSLTGSSTPTFQLQAAFGSRPGDASYTWTDISTRGRRLTYGRGRLHELDRTDTGEGTATLKDQDRYFDSTYTSSPVYPNVVPLVPFKATATIAGTTYNLMAHYVESWQRHREGPNYADRVIATVDGFEILSRLILQPPKATLTTALGGNKDLTYISVKPGAEGNKVSVVYRMTSHTLSAPQINVSSHRVSVDLGTSGFTANQIITAIGLDTTAPRRVIVGPAPGSNGTGTISTSMAETHLAGGGPLVFPQELTGARTTRTLDWIGWPTALRSISTGKSPIAARTFQPGDSVSSLEHLQQVCGEGGEEGIVYIDGRGYVKFLDRWSATQPPYTISQATFTDQPIAPTDIGYQDAVPSYDQQLIINEWVGTRAGGITQTAIDLNSQAKYLRRIRQISSLLTTDDDVITNLEWRLAHYKDPLDRLDSIKVMPNVSTVAWQACLAREPGDRVTVVQHPPGGGTDSREYIVQHIDADLDLADPVRSSFTFALWPADQRNWLILNDAVYGKNGSNKAAA